MDLKNKIIKWWKFSSMKFYYMNLCWNFKFWFFSTKQYREVYFFKRDYNSQNKKITKRRFVGYLYKDKIYLDNPGIPNIEQDVWKEWKNKKLIN